MAEFNLGHPLSPADTLAPLVLKGCEVSLPTPRSTMEAIVNGADAQYGPGLAPLPNSDRIRVAFQAGGLVFVAMTAAEVRDLQQRFRTFLADCA